MTTWHVYDSAPIDFGWFMTKTFKQVIADFDESEFENCLEITQLWSEAKAIAEAYTSWEGDFSVELRIFTLPNPDNNDFIFGFVWKQSNNGQTYIISPLPLLWISPDSQLVYWNEEHEKEVAKKLDGKYNVVREDGYLTISRKISTLN